MDKRMLERKLNVLSKFEGTKKRERVMAKGVNVRGEKGMKLENLRDGERVTGEVKVVSNRDSDLEI